MKPVFCFGELLLRLSPQLNRQWIDKATMPVFIGGAELNVATALALWGVPVTYCTALPDHYLAKELAEELASKNIGNDKIFWQGNRIGTYYLPQGADMKAAGVIYDRAHSSFAELTTGQIDWDKVLHDVSFFHFSAINPALNHNVAAVCKEALEAATKKGITISVDLNYRAKLWQYGKKPTEVMPELAQYCHIIMGNIWAAETMLGIAIEEELDGSEEQYLQQAQKTSATIQKHFIQCRQVANTFRFDRGEGIEYFATLYTNHQLYISKQHEATTIVDKVGSGDCFMAGLLYSFYHGLPPQNTIDYAAAAAYKKLFVKGDTTTSSAAEINKEVISYA